MYTRYPPQLRGIVDRVDEQHHATLFVCRAGLPLIPVGSLWVVSEGHDGPIGHDVAPSLRSVVAAYARTWGVLFAVGGLLVGGVGGTAVGLASAALCLWSWTWRTAWTRHARLRSDIIQLVFGVRCDPLRMGKQLLAHVRPRVDAAWAELADGRTPQDVARHGAASPEQAAHAYAQLRLAERDATGPARREAHAAAERLLTEFPTTRPLGAPCPTPTLPDR